MTTNMTAPTAPTAPTITDLRSKLSQVKALTDPKAARWPDDWRNDAANAATARADFLAMFDAWFTQQQAEFTQAEQKANEAARGI